MLALDVSEVAIAKVSKELHDVSRPLKDRFKALFTLKNIKTGKCIEEIAKGFLETFALLNAAVLSKTTTAILILINVLEDE